MRRVCKDELRIAVCQMKSTDEIEFNQKQIKKFLGKFESKKNHIDLISFPENSLYFRLKTGAINFGVAASDLFFRELSSWAKKYQTCVHIGSVALQNPRGKLLNVTVWIDRGGNVRFPYSKIHLFDVDVKGEKAVRESDYFDSGKAAAIVKIDHWKVGLSICYDLRFSDLYLKYAKAEVDLILIPSAFLVTTGQAHWHTLLRARAIESQAFVAAAAQGGEHASKSGEKRHTFGHSLIVGPWGEIISEVTDKGPQFKVQLLKRERIEQVRKQIPMRMHRKVLSSVIKE